MRLHRLEVTAFGPFAGRAVLDLDDLAAGGLFLIHGPTGSGKTSLLDAICYALFANVPGDRPRKGLRSDHASPDLVPQVTLEFTSAGRRLKVRRSPEYSRSKKRGTGQLKVNATVLLEEFVGGSWVQRSTGHEEVGDVLLDVLGMGLAQFAKVALLPQGQFAAFLRASPEDRRDVLERLFDIGVYTDVETWLSDERRRGAAQIDQERRALRADLARVEDLLLEDLLVDDPQDAARVDEALGGVGLAEREPAALPDVLARLADALSLAVSTALAECDEAAAAEGRAAAALALAEVQEAARGKAEAARALLAERAEERAGRDARDEAVLAAARAATVAGYLAAQGRADADLRGSAAAVRDGTDRLTDSLGPEVDLGDEDIVREVHAVVTACDPVVEELRRSVEERAAKAARRQELLDALAESASVRDTALADHERLTGALESARVDLDRHRAVGGRLAELELREQALTRIRTVLDLVAADRELVESLRPRVGDALDRALCAGKELLRLRQRRLDGMAAELAAGLTHEVACPVCGSLEHPAPAGSSGEVVTADDLSVAEAAHAAASEAHRILESERLTASTRADTRLREVPEQIDPDTVDTALREVRGELDRARTVTAALAAHQERVDELVVHLTQVRTACTTADTDVASHTALLRTLDEDDAAAQTAIALLEQSHAACACGATGDSAASTHARVRRELAEHLRSLTARTASAERADAADQALGAALHEAGFVDGEAARAAALPPAEVTRLRGLVAAYDRDVLAATTVLDDPDVRAAVASTADDVPGRREASERARAQLIRSTSRESAARRRLAGLDRLRPALLARCRDLGPAMERHEAIRSLADLTCGTSPDNVRKMRLTSYVLAARLEKVVALANERLARMGGGRYVLEHTDERVARGARSGLGLRVLDQWTGQARDTATLSGGESFMAALALALGLADAVREESGGLEIGTLFVDEGFGTLDDSSLEDVLGVLDALREGGRAVGVVSHVADLRTRITHQVAVHKTTTGSSVTVTVGGVDTGAA